MKKQPILSSFTEYFDHWVIVDKRGRTIFFPWGDKKPGYLIKYKRDLTKARRFFITSFLICMVILVAALSISNNFWSIILSMGICFGGWYFAYYLYVSKMIKSLSPAEASYEKIILDKYTPPESEETTQVDTPFPVQWNVPVRQKTIGVFGRIKRIWYLLSDDVLCIASLFIGVLIIIIWLSDSSQYYGQKPKEYIVVFLACCFLGFYGYFMANGREIPERNFFWFIQRRLPGIIIAVVLWMFALWNLYKFLAAILM